MIPAPRDPSQPGIPSEHTPNVDTWERDRVNDLEPKGWRRINEEIRHFYRHPAVTMMTWGIASALATVAAVYLTAQLTR